jgi:hypothetical protein
MRILLDESVPHGLRLLLRGHAAFTVSYQGWAGRKNGDLLALAEKAGFELLITADQELRYQQNLTTRNVSILVLGTNDWLSLRAAQAEIVSAIDHMPASGYLELAIPDLPWQSP